MSPYTSMQQSLISDSSTGESAPIAPSSTQEDDPPLEPVQLRRKEQMYFTQNGRG